jgi:hypothetical protein
MDSKDRDESAIRLREETLARRMGEALDRIDPQGAGACPDAERIAAYAEQALGSDEAAQWEGHFASCARCRKILRVLAASAETPLAGKEVAQLGELVSVRAPVEISKKPARQAHPKRVDWPSRWLAPALGVAAALAVWFAMRPPWRATDRSASQTLIAQAPKQESPMIPAAPEADRLSRVAPQQDQKTQAALPADRSSANTRAPQGSPAEVGNALKKASPSGDVAKGILQKEEKFGSSSSALETRSSTVPAPPLPQPSRAKAALEPSASAPAPEARTQISAPPSSTPRAPAAPSSQSVTITGSAPPVETTNGTLGSAIQQERAADLPLNGRNYNDLTTLHPAQGYTVLLKAPSGLSFWRAGKGGVIERSTDAGKTWISDISPTQEDWLAGAAVSDTVCWLAGRNGAIARSTDGNQWERVTPSAQAETAAGKMVDWIGITARDSRTATIRASDGRKFTTLDGGNTWQPQ